MSTQATRTINGSAGRSTAGAQSVCLERGGTTGGDSREKTAGTVSPVAGAHVPILHLTASLLVPNGDVLKGIQGVTFEDQHNQAMDIYEFLNTPSLYLPRLNEGAKCYEALVNVTKTSLVKFIYCMVMGSSLIGANASPVDGKLVFLQGNGNTDLGPPQPVCLPATVVEPNMVAVMTVTQLSTSITSKGSGYSYPLLARNAVNMTG